MRKILPVVLIVIVLGLSVKTYQLSQRKQDIRIAEVEPSGCSRVVFSTMTNKPGVFNPLAGNNWNIQEILNRTLVVSTIVGQDVDQVRFRIRYNKSGPGQYNDPNNPGNLLITKQNGIIFSGRSVQSKPAGTGTEYYLLTASIADPDVQRFDVQAEMHYVGTPAEQYCPNGFSELGFGGGEAGFIPDTCNLGQCFSSFTINWPEQAANPLASASPSPGQVSSPSPSSGSVSSPSPSSGSASSPSPSPSPSPSASAAVGSSFPPTQPETGTATLLTVGAIVLGLGLLLIKSVYYK